MKTYLCVYLGSLFLALLITPIVIWLARRLKAADHPGVRTVHKKPIARIGGVAIFLPTIFLVILVLLLLNVIGDAFRNVLPGLTVLLFAAGFIFFVGLIDDIMVCKAALLWERSLTTYYLPAYKAAV